MNANEVIERLDELFRVYIEAEPLSDHFGYAEAIAIAKDAVMRMEDDLK